MGKIAKRLPGHVKWLPVMLAAEAWGKAPWEVVAAPAYWIKRFQAVSHARDISE